MVNKIKNKHPTTERPEYVVSSFAYQIKLECLFIETSFDSTFLNSRAAFKSDQKKVKNSITSGVNNILGRLASQSLNHDATLEI